MAAAWIAHENLGVNAERYWLEYQDAPCEIRGWWALIEARNPNWTTPWALKRFDGAMEALMWIEELCGLGRDPGRWYRGTQ